MPPFLIRLTIESERPLSLMHAVDDVPKVGDHLDVGGRAVIVRTVDDTSHDRVVYVTAVELGRSG